MYFGVVHPLPKGRGWFWRPRRRRALFGNYDSFHPPVSSLPPFPALFTSSAPSIHLAWFACSFCVLCRVGFPSSSILAVRGWLVGACKNDLLCFKWKTFPMKRKKWRFLERDGTSWTVMFSSPAFANTFQNSTSCDQMIFPIDPLSKVYFVQWMTTI